MKSMILYRSVGVVFELMQEMQKIKEKLLEFGKYQPSKVEEKYKEYSEAHRESHISFGDFLVPILQDTIFTYHRL